jgi:sterol desaturase/sphingolipid hydroxylase (fatty acid hydroxylase superfamily)
MDGPATEFALLAGTLWLVRILSKGLGPRWWTTAAFKEGAANCAFYFFDAALMMAPLGAVTFFIYDLMPHVADQQLLKLPTALQFVLCVFLSDVAGYWRHRFLHTRMLWPSHAVHHSDEHVNWLTLVRIHPIERVASVTADSLMLGALGFDPSIIAANGLLRHFYGYIEHADIRWTLGPLRYVFATPHFHRWHHSSDEIARDKNFAVIFSFIDLTFGTFFVPDAPPKRFGIGAARMGFITLLAYPFQQWVSQIAARKRHSRPCA